MNRFAALIAAVLFFSLVGCSPSQGAIQTAIAKTNEAIPTSTNTKAPASTSTPVPTPTPTETRAPTQTREPTNTTTPIPEPVTYSGTGSKVLDIDDDMVGSPRVVDITYSGGGNFAVISYDKDNNHLDLLVNTIGDYQGRLPIDWKDDETATRFEIKASGDWSFTFYPISKEYQHVSDPPSTYQGSGDDVVIFTSSPDIGRAECNTRGNFAIWAITANGSDLLVNEISPYNGEFMFPSGTAVIFVTAPGKWSLETTSKNN